MSANSQLLIYQTPDGNIKIDVRLEDETVWLAQAHMAELFNKDKRTISEHIRNIFNEGELMENAVVRNFRTTASDDKQYDVKYYNLDVIISVGYRVKSMQGTQFRIWATQRLDTIIQLNGRELLSHAGKISHEIALEKSAFEYEKYREELKILEHEQSLRELERDISELKKQKPDGA